jgi:hypothetical protein
MTDRCAQCLSVLPERLGYRSPQGHSLCGPCYFALWGPKGADQLTPMSEGHRPQSRRPRRGRPIWMPGPTGDLDPEEQVRRSRLRRSR